MDCMTKCMRAPNLCPATERRWSAGTRCARPGRHRAIDTCVGDISDQLICQSGHRRRWINGRAARQDIKLGSCHRSSVGRAKKGSIMSTESSSSAWACPVPNMVGSKWLVLISLQSIDEGNKRRTGESQNKMMH
jgi:hypothetical protein